eukprot:8074148-Ditylum_brightwellii.AAC.1
MEQLEIFELNANVPYKALELSSARRKKKVNSELWILLNEWRKQLVMLPEEVVEKTHENSTHFTLASNQRTAKIQGGTSIIDPLACVFQGNMK